MHTSSLRVLPSLRMMLSMLRLRAVCAGAVLISLHLHPPQSSPLSELERQRSDRSTVALLSSQANNLSHAGFPVRHFASAFRLPHHPFVLECAQELSARSAAHF